MTLSRLSVTLLTKSSVVVLLILVLCNPCTIGVHSLNCDKIQSDLNQQSSINDLLRYVSLKMPNRQYATDVFSCMGAFEQRIPTDYLDDDNSDRNFMYGSGYTMYYADGTIVRDRVRSRFMRLLWSGKVFKKLSNVDTFVQLYNFFPYSRNVGGAAIVYYGPSVHDGLNNTILLDYRNNLTKTSDIRDELRDIYWNGQPSRIYLGRLYHFNGLENEILTSAWENLTNYDYDFNFILDARKEVQNDVPGWALRSDELTD